MFGDVLSKEVFFLSLEMKLSIYFILCGAYFINIVSSDSFDRRDNPDPRYSGSRFRDGFHPDHQFIDYELPHGQNDGRCQSRDNRFEGNPSRQTRYGVVVGRKVSLCDKPGLPLPDRPGQGNAMVRQNVLVFLGIPYAEPPTQRADLQFQPPRPPLAHPQISAFSYKPSCPQNVKYLGYNKGINNTDEDCLYLNVYVPEKPLPGFILYPVMVYIHGGNWDHGSANQFPAHMLAAQGVVVVTFNYRLGHLGFLSTGDSASIGNYGILDQQLALQWVNENIRNFDGDPSLVTLFGFDAGAVSASLLAMSPRMKGMVKRVIAQNGSPLADWGTIVDRIFAFNSSRILGEALGCSTEDSVKLVACLRTRTNNEYRHLEMKPRIGWLPWGPVVDNFTRIAYKPLLPKSPEDMLQEGNPFNRDFSIMTGTSRDEGVTILLADQSLYIKNYRFTVETFRKKIKDLQAMYNYSVNADGIFDAIDFMYRPSLDTMNETLLRQAYIDLLTDRYYKAPNYRYAKHLVRNGIPTYLYVCNYTMEGYRFTYSWQGISSETEYLLLTGAPFMDPKYYPSDLNLQAARWTRADREMSHFYLQAWTDFAKYGNPTKSSFHNAILWQQATQENFVFLNLNSTNETAEMIRNYRERECEFWNCYMPFLIDRERPTLPPTLEPGLEELRLVTGALYGVAAMGALVLIITIVCCILYCRIRRYDSY